MAGRIEGITLAINGDTTNLGKSLTSVNKNIKDTQTQLKDVERLLKLDPTNTELLAQKQRLLAQAAGSTQEKLASLRAAAASANEALANQPEWEKQYKPLQAALDKSDLAMKKLQAEDEKMKEKLSNGKISDEQYKSFQTTLLETAKKHEELKQAKANLDKEFAGKHIDQTQYDALQRELVETELQFKKLEQASDDSGEKLKNFGEKMENVSGSAKKVSDFFSPVSKGVAALGVAAVASIPGTEDFRDALSKLDENAIRSSVDISEARDAFEKFNAVSGEADSSVEAVSNLLASGFSGNDLTLAIEAISGAVTKFPDTLKIESLADGIQETIATRESAGQFAEMLDRLGIGAENFNDTLKLCYTEEMRQAAVLNALSYTEMPAYYQGWLQNNEVLVQSRNSTLEMQEALANFATQIAPVVTQITEFASTVVEWFNSLNDGGQITIASIVGIVGAIGPVAGAVANVSSVIGKFTGTASKVGGAIGDVAEAASSAGTVVTTTGGAVSKLSTLFSFLAANPIVLVIAAIAAAIAILGIFFATNEDVRNFVLDTWEKIKGAFQAFDDWLSSVFSTDWTERFGAFGNILNAFFENVKNIWESIKQIFGGVITFIKGVFTGDWEMAWQGIVDVFAGIFGLIEAIVKAPINGLIGLINSMIQGITDGLNLVIDLLNKISITIPEWVPVIGGNEFGFDIPPLTAAKIPFLAKGAVLPPNNPFLAVVGDQQKGVNVEGPLSLFMDGVRGVLREQGASSPSQQLTIRVLAGDGFTRYLKFELDRESNYQGASLIKGGGR